MGLLEGPYRLVKETVSFKSNFLVQDTIVKHVTLLYSVYTRNRKQGEPMDRKIYEKQPAICNCMNIRRASLAVTEVYDEFLAPSGLKVSQFALLSHIKRLAPVNVSDLALEMRVDRTTLVRNLKPMESKGLIIDTSAKGSRNRQLKLTEKGLEALASAAPLWSEAQRFMQQYLGEKELNTLTTLLSKVEALVP